MSAFYPNSSPQVDVLSSPYVQDQKYTSYSDSPIIHDNNMMMYLHGASSMSTHNSIDRNEMMFNGERKTNGLSLSLSTHMTTSIPPPSYQQFSNPETSMRFGASNNVHQYQQAEAARDIMKSRFLKVAQQLLDEVVSVQDALKKQESGKDQSMKKVEDESESVQCEELSANDCQDLQNKLDKLLAMLDEIDRRYKQYHHQMQVLVASFDMIAGCGGAKPYTTLALKTISRHFRSLRDALSVQIQATRKSLGENDSGQGGVIPRLRYVDQQIRQQRALQQFGMMRHAWRPQRGLPESAVTILRAWLFEHFLHPYPKDSEKTMLARQTGLTRSQVGNWFINARVRLWKPMVEEMYKEEFGEAELNLKSSPENAVTSVEPENHHNNMNTNGFYPHDQNGNMPFQVDNQVSLALGLRRIDGVSVENSVEPETAEYSYFGQVNQLQKFGNSHLLDDFVV